ncbi:hypothetical protein AgCh_009255 [Apium graveolens]
MYVKAQKNITNDRNALNAFKAHITLSDPSNNILSLLWSNKIPTCKWEGVSCSIRRQRVTALDLSNMNLTATISPHLEATIPWEIGNLVQLKRLDIPSASLTGTIPSSIFNMTYLESLNFQNNSLSGSLPQDITYNLPALKHLSFSLNNLSGQIPSSLWECRGLQILLLMNNTFTGSIPKNIGNLTSLQVLNLKFNQLTGTLPDEIANLNLEMISIGHNGFTGPIPSKIFNVSTLRNIDMQFNSLSGHLPSDIRLPNLEQLYLDNNKLSGWIPNSITNASKITLLQLFHNYFEGSIPNTLGNLKYLSSLHLSGNRLTKESGTTELSFFNSLSNCKFLETLTISENYLYGFIPNSVGNLSTFLHYFEAYESNIKGEIPLQIGNLSGIQALELYGNELTGIIPTTIGRLTEMRRLTLSRNGLQGSLPNELCNMKNIAELNISQNRLSGSIPTCMGDLITLEKLSLDSNRLTSNIPSNFWSLVKLISLNLSSNLLIGNITSDIGNLNIATQIDLSRNQLSGDIPSTIGNAQVLNFLSLADNNLQGPIPKSFSNLKGLEFLDLSTNNLSGEIPESLGTIRYLEYLNVSYNMLQGEIPTTGSFANFLADSFAHMALFGAPWLNVPRCKSQKVPKSRSKFVHLLKYILPPTFLVILTSCVVYIWVSKYKRNRSKPGETESSLVSWRRFSHYDLQRATESFSERNLLGRGGFASVFKGTLSDGTTTAVKVFDMQCEKSMKSFDCESEVFVNIRHRNLLKIISSCTNFEFRALVLEYMPNGSLDKWLHLHNYCLDTLQRINIMIDVANALEYLHYGQATTIVHCDLKPSNVLLDEDMIAHVSDFGIAKLLGEEEFRAQTQTLGTIGYMAPEYGREGTISRKGDVYSYGIVLMETFTRKKPTDEMFSGKLNLRSWVNKNLRCSFLQVVDNKLMETVDDEHIHAEEQCVVSILDLALDCSRDSPAQRITMKETVHRLEQIKLMFQMSINAEVSKR